MTSFLRTLRNLCHDERAATAVVVGLMIPVLVGLAGFTIDIGHIALVQKQLQASADAAALAGGYNIPNSTAVATAKSYSAASGDKNALGGGVTATMVTGYPVLKCLTTTGVNCAGTELSGGANAIQVQEQATVPMWFAPVLGFASTYTLTATSTASAKGGIGEALNVMIVLDTTRSMETNTDNNCGLGANATREQCALAGVQTLLTGLNPTLDYVGLMAFPGLQSSSEASQDYTCGESIPSSGTQAYGNAPIYQIVGLSNNFKTSSSAKTLNTGSNLVAAVGDAGCSSGVSAPGGQGTYYAEAIDAAQAALLTLSSTQSPPSQNVIVFLSDGGANTTKAETDFDGYIGNCSTNHGVTSCVASTTMTVTSCPNGCQTSTTSSQEAPLVAGQVLTGSGVTAGTTIVKQLTGTTGGVGTYEVSSSQKVGASNSTVSLTSATEVTLNGDTYDQNTDQCQQAIDAARAAAKTGTWVYSIAYGSSTATGGSSTCTTDTSAVISGMSGLSSCTTMQYIANSENLMPDPSKFYSNNNNGADCPGSNTIENLVSLFSNLSTNLTEPRLIPNNTT
jgi:Flp pilus assembly protein TadG